MRRGRRGGRRGEEEGGKERKETMSTGTLHSLDCPPVQLRLLEASIYPARQLHWNPGISSVQMCWQPPLFTEHCLMSGNVWNKPQMASTCTTPPPTHTHTHTHRHTQ